MEQIVDMTATQSNKPPVKAGLLDRLKSGLVICAEGYLFELERRGYLQAGAFVPEAVVENPEDRLRQGGLVHLRFENEDGQAS